MPDTNPDAVKLLSDDEVAEIEARAAKATPPPWECGPTYRFIGAKNAPVVPYGGGAICNPNDNNGARLYPANRKNNAEFMAHAREDIPALCATVRALRQQNRDLKAIVDIGTSDDPGTALAKIHKIQNEATTALREQLAEAQVKVRQLGREFGITEGTL